MRQGVVMNAKSSRISSVILGLAAAGLLGLVGYGVVQSQDFEPSPFSTGKGSLELVEDLPVYSVSTDPGVEILNLRFSGGSGRLTPEYQLYGDGRLVRRILDRVSREAVYSDEITLGLEDIDLLIGLVVESHLPELTEERFRSATGRRPMKSFDGSTVRLTVRFDSYASPGQESEGPFEAGVKMHDPVTQLRVFPDLREAAGLIALRDALDGYFEHSVVERIDGTRDGGI